MGFQPIVAPAKGGKKNTGVHIFVGGRKTPKLCVTIYPDTLPTKFKLHTMLEAALGEGDDHGKLRLATTGLCAFELKGTGSRGAALSLRLPMPAAADIAEAVRGDSLPARRVK